MFPIRGGTLAQSLGGGGRLPQSSGSGGRREPSSATAGLSRRCYARGCQNRQERESLFYSFPPEEDRRKLWLSIIERDDMMYITDYSFSKLCPVHYTKCLISEWFTDPVPRNPTRREERVRSVSPPPREVSTFTGITYRKTVRSTVEIEVLDDSDPYYTMCGCIINCNCKTHNKRFIDEEKENRKRRRH